MVENAAKLKCNQVISHRDLDPKNIMWKIDVPYIIDTPFARIDKEHRGKILEQFFKQLNGQVIILSTDEEIVGDYCNVISDIVSNTFVLNHTINGNTEILSDTYFGGSI